MGEKKNFISEGLCLEVLKNPEIEKYVEGKSYDYLENKIALFQEFYRNKISDQYHACRISSFNSAFCMPRITPQSIASSFSQWSTMAMRRDYEAYEKLFIMRTLNIAPTIKRDIAGGAHNGATQKR